MTDIFLSYASGNRRKISVLVELFEKLGWSVWWDCSLAAGREWSMDIEAAARQARCIVVAWSRASVTSDWVIREATIGNERRVLIPVLLEPVTIPPPFSSIQAARLTAWAEGPQSAELTKLLSRLSEVLDATPRQINPETAAAASSEMSRVEVAEAVFAYCAAVFAGNQKRNGINTERLRPAYARLTAALSPISDEDLHELIERYLSDFAA